MDYHQRIQRKTANQSDWAFKVSPLQTHNFGVQKKSPESAPANEAHLWKNYQTAKQLHHSSANPSLAAPEQTQALPIQAKLTIGKPGDKYEQEADSVAERVMAMSEPSQVQRQELPEQEEELQMKPLAATISPLVQRDELPEEEDKLQTKPDDNAIQREVAPQEEEEQLQMKPVGNLIQCEELPEEEIQTKQSPTANSPIPTPSLENRLSNSKGGGSPLSDEVRSFMEPRFGADFSGVRVHTDSEAVQMNRDVNAQAFAHGRDLYFGAGKAPAKDALTAHELTHVVQQTGRVQKIEKIENSTLHSLTGLTSNESINRKKYSSNLNSDIKILMSKLRLTREEIKQARQLIAKESDQKKRKKLYLLLQEKVKYRNQLDNESKENGENIGYKMCNLTSLAMCLSYLGISNPDPKIRFEDTLEKIRVKKKLPSREDTIGWGGVAKHFGVEIKFIGWNVTENSNWYKKSVLPYLEKGDAVMMSITKHIVRLQSVTSEGLVVDDPNGKVILKKGEKYGWKTKNKKKENYGEDVVWPWSEVAQHQMFWIAAFSK
jgi:Domain of unknown function (DUF4157)/Peptidase_C39 like family